MKTEIKLLALALALAAAPAASQCNVTTGQIAGCSAAWTAQPSPGFDVAGARQAGYTAQEILRHLDADPERRKLITDPDILRQLNAPTPEEQARERARWDDLKIAAVVVPLALAVLVAGLYGAAVIYRRCARSAFGDVGAVAIIIALVLLAPWLLPFGGLLKLLDRQPTHEDARRTVHIIN